MKICIIGAGAIGTLFAARLGSHAGNQVTLVTKRQLPGEASGRATVMLRTRSEIIQADVGVVRAGEKTGPQEIILVAVKTPALPSVVDIIQPLLGSDTIVIFANNGLPWWYFHDHGGPGEGRQLDLLDPGGRLWSQIGPHRSAMAIVYALSTLLGERTVQVENPVSRILLGSANPEHRARLEELAAGLQSPSGVAGVAEDVRKAAWEKLALLYASAPLSVLTQSAPREIFRDPRCVELSKSLMKEVLSVARAHGSTATLDVDAVAEGSKDVAHKPSILQDLESGRQMEVDAIFTVVCQLAREADVDIPTIQMMSAMVEARARAAGLSSRSH